MKAMDLPSMNAGSVVRAALLPALVTLVLGSSFLLGGRVLSSQKYDQDLYHIQAIRQFESQLPSPDLSDYPSATGPGYHLLYALSGSVIGSDLVTLRWYSLVFAAGLVVVIAGFTTNVTMPMTAAVLASPIAVSYYLLGSAVYVATDNLAWLLAAIPLGLVVFLPTRPWVLLLSGSFMLLAVLVRQNFVWLAGPIILAGLLTCPLVRTIPWSSRFQDDEAAAGWGRLVLSLVVTVPACLLLAALVASWGGLVPPNFQDFHQKNLMWVTLGFALSVFGLYGPFFMLCLPRPRELIRGNLPVLLTVGLLGALCALVPPSDFAPDQGRYAGVMWTLVRLGPVVGERSLVLAFFAFVGAICLVVLWLGMLRAGRSRHALVLLVAWAAIVASNFPNSQCFQRYFDLPTLMVLVWGLALCLPARPDEDQPAPLGPALLAMVLVLLFAAKAL